MKDRFILKQLSIGTQQYLEVVGSHCRYEYGDILVGIVEAHGIDPVAGEYTEFALKEGSEVVTVFQDPTKPTATNVFKLLE